MNLFEIWSFFMIKSTVRFLGIAFWIISELNSDNFWTIHKFCVNYSSSRTYEFFGYYPGSIHKLVKKKVQKLFLNWFTEYSSSVHESWSVGLDDKKWLDLWHVDSFRRNFASSQDWRFIESNPKSFLNRFLNNWIIDSYLIHAWIPE